MDSKFKQQRLTAVSVVVSRKVSEGDKPAATKVDTFVFVGVQVAMMVSISCLTVAYGRPVAPERADARVAVSVTMGVPLTRVGLIRTSQARLLTASTVPVRSLIKPRGANKTSLFVCW